jgi:hypothetical protein
MSENKKWCPLIKTICNNDCAWHDVTTNTCAVLSLSNGLFKLVDETIEQNVNLDLIRKII